MKPKELDVVRLTDGREVTILETFENATAFYVECPRTDTGDSDFFMVNLGQIEKIIWTAK